MNDCTGMELNEHGTPVSVHLCSACGRVFTVCPPAPGGFDGCTFPGCGSYDLDRDVEWAFVSGDLEGQT